MTGRNDAVGRFFADADFAVFFVSRLVEPDAREVQAAAQLSELSPALRQWADDLGERDRAYLETALHAANLLAFLNAGMLNLHADAEKSRRDRQRGTANRARANQRRSAEAFTRAAKDFNNWRIAPSRRASLGKLNTVEQLRKYLKVGRMSDRARRRLAAVLKAFELPRK